MFDELTGVEDKHGFGLSQSVLRIGQNDAGQVYLHFHGGKADLCLLTNKLGKPAYIRSERSCSFLVGGEV